MDVVPEHASRFGGESEEVMAIHDEAFSPAHDALNRMRRAFERSTGCHLTADMIESLSVTVIGQMWNEDDPRREAAGKDE